MRLTSKHLAITLGLAAGALNCAGEVDTDVPSDAMEAPRAATATLVGLALDWSENPIVGGEVVLSINGEHVGTTVLTDASGLFRLDVDVDAIEAGYATNQEVNVLVYSPYEDMGAAGTFEGDRIRLLPLTLNEFTDVSALRDGAVAQLRTAYVPLQAPGYAIDDDLIANGGELTWQVPNPNGGELLDVTLIVEAGSIILDDAEVQRELTMTFLDSERAPMQIPGEGYGVMWTIQPRDVRFDPPASIRIEGDRAGLVGLTDVTGGTAFPLFGASLDRGWQYYGDTEIASIDGDRLTLETSEGIIHRGAWGHVLSNPESDAGMLVTCINENTGNYVVCAIIGQRAFDETGLFDQGLQTNVSRTQADYNDEFDRLFWYTDKELRCSGCTNVGAAEAQMATNLDLGLPEDDGTPVFVVVSELCASEVGNQIDARDQILFDRLTVMATVDTDEADIIDIGEGAGDTPRTAIWEFFCSDDTAGGACPAFDPAAVDVTRRQFTRQFTFITSSDHCDQGDTQAGNPGRN